MKTLEVFCEDGTLRIKYNIQNFNRRSFAVALKKCTNIKEFLDCFMNTTCLSLMVSNSLKGDVNNIHPDGFCGYALDASLANGYPLKMSIEKDRKVVIDYMDPLTGSLAKKLGSEKMDNLVLGFDDTNEPIKPHRTLSAQNKEVIRKMNPVAYPYATQESPYLNNVVLPYDTKTDLWFGNRNIIRYSPLCNGKGNYHHAHFGSEERQWIILHYLIGKTADMTGNGIYSRFSNYKLFSMNKLHLGFSSVDGNDTRSSFFENLHYSYATDLNSAYIFPRVIECTDQMIKILTEIYNKHVGEKGEIFVEMDITELVKVTFANYQDSKNLSNKFFETSNKDFSFQVIREVPMRLKELELLMASTTAWTISIEERKAAILRLLDVSYPSDLSDFGSEVKSCVHHTLAEIDVMKRAIVVLMKYEKFNRTYHMDCEKSVDYNKAKIEESLSSREMSQVLTMDELLLLKVHFEKVKTSCSIMYTTDLFDDKYCGDKFVLFEVFSENIDTLVKKVEAWSIFSEELFNTTQTKIVDGSNRLNLYSIIEANLSTTVAQCICVPRHRELRQIMLSVEKQKLGVLINSLQTYKATDLELRNGIKFIECNNNENDLGHVDRIKTTQGGFSNGELEDDDPLSQQSWRNDFDFNVIKQRSNSYDVSDLLESTQTLMDTQDNTQSINTSQEEVTFTELPFSDGSDIYGFESTAKELVEEINSDTFFPMSEVPSMEENSLTQQPSAQETVSIEPTSYQLTSTETDNSNSGEKNANISLSFD